MTADSDFVQTLEKSMIKQSLILFLSPESQTVSTFDMLKGYWQVPLTQRAREISAFVTPSGLYQYKVMHFGMKNAPATFQRMVNKLIQDIDGCEGYIDDVVIYSDNWSDHIRQIKRFLQIM